MNASTISQTEFESMFGTQSAEAPSQGSGFSFTETDSIFTSPKEKVEEKEEEKKEEKTETEEEKLSREAQEELEKLEDNKDDTDSLFKEKEEEKQSPLDLKNYFDLRIKEGKFLPLEDGKMESPEDIDALIEANFDHKIQEIKESAIKSAYEGKSAAWKYVLSSAEKFQNPSDLIPLLTGVNNIDTISELDPTNEQQAETIVRIALTRRNEAPEVIEDQIAMFKENKKLETMAGKYQPILVNEENKKLVELQKQKEQEDLSNLEMIKQIHEGAVANLETPFLGRHKLKNEEKAAIYELIAEPSEEQGGYKIFTEIDNLYEKKDFETLREIALLLNNKKAHRHYLGVTIGEENSERVIRKIKTTSTGSTSTDSELPDSTPKLSRPKAPQAGSGFGFFSK